MCPYLHAFILSFVKLPLCVTVTLEGLRAAGHVAATEQRRFFHPADGTYSRRPNTCFCGTTSSGAAINCWP